MCYFDGMEPNTQQPAHEPEQAQSGTVNELLALAHLLLHDEGMRKSLADLVSTKAQLPLRNDRERRLRIWLHVGLVLACLVTVAVLGALRILQSDILAALLASIVTYAVTSLWRREDSGESE